MGLSRARWSAVATSRDGANAGKAGQGGDVELDGLCRYFRGKLAKQIARKSRMSKQAGTRLAPGEGRGRRTKQYRTSTRRRRPKERKKRLRKERAKKKATREADTSWGREMSRIYWDEEGRKRRDLKNGGISTTRALAHRTGI